jgi:uncharacterized membrane protein
MTAPSLVTLPVTPRGTSRGARAGTFALALTLTTLTLWALAIGHAGASCPAEAGTFSCVALVRPALRSLGPVPLAPLVALGAATEALAALLLLVRGAKVPFARDVAILSAVGAGVALGLQPLTILVAKRACLVCLLALVAQLALALVFAKIARTAGANMRAVGGAFFVALVTTGGGAWMQGMAQRRADDEASQALAAIERKDGRIVLVERRGCAYCEALRLDLLARPEILARLRRTGLARREAEHGEPAPILLARDRDGRETARELGFQADPAAYEPVLAAAER